MDENKTIAVNTIVLTIKLVITLLCNFIVSRLILQALGADDYGLYNVVGGIVIMLALISTSMISTSYRYLAVEIGNKETGDPQKVFSTLTLIHAILAVLLLIVGLPIGAFYINNYLNITNASLADAHFVFIFSLIATVFSILSVPSNGLLVAEEKFKPISLIEIARAILNVAIAFYLLNYPGNRLRIYAILMAVINIAYPMAFILYCRYKYSSIVNFKLNRNRKDYKEIAFFTGWMLLGASAVVGKTQGVAMVINLFFRNSINAAFGVATQIGHAASMFTTTLRQAVTPQIMKNQEGNSARSLNLVYAISRYTYLIMLVICVPLLLCMDTILELWLGPDNIPPMTSVFAIFLLLGGMVSNLNSGFDASIQASGKIRKNQIGYTIINLSIIPIVYLLYKLNFPAYTNVIVALVLSVVTLFFQAYIMQELTNFSYIDFLRKTVMPSIITTCISICPMLVLRVIVPEKLVMMILLIMVSLIWTSISVYLTGLNNYERDSIVGFVKSKIK